MGEFTDRFVFFYICCGVFFLSVAIVFGSNLIGQAMAVAFIFAIVLSVTVEVEHRFIDNKEPRK